MDQIVLEVAIGTSLSLSLLLANACMGCGSQKAPWPEGDANLVGVGHRARVCAPCPLQASKQEEVRPESEYGCLLFVPPALLTASHFRELNCDTLV